MSGENMNLSAKLTIREREVTELLAWGATKKEVATHLFISERTVENHTRSIFGKTGCTKVNQLSAWWFCTRFHIPLSLSPLARKVAAGLLLLIYASGTFGHDIDQPRVRTASSRIIVRSRTSRRKENNYQFTAA